ncbi:MAG TPA: 4-aminobutyrate--2-oxoglutarate transaminase [Burkholderiaceae bacterium]|jgi:4-aminobutyrate aminotransferase/(S)-3-amino-2-methylpropionate transaminase|nr:4-aminobutyrate--2-oxoglutarate transaminase [Burkholderiaceae bacterium]
MKREASLSNAALMARRRAAIARGVGQVHEIFVERARDCEVWDVEGRRYIDFAGGIGVVNTGHRHPKVVAAVAEQLQHVTHTCFQLLAYEPYVELAERLSRLMPGEFAKKAMFMSTGAEAVENAIKVARVHTGRDAVIAFGGAFHGRTNMAMALTGKVAPYKAGFGPFPAGIFHARFPNALHGIGVDQALGSVQHILKCDVGPDEVAALIIEPVQGEGGFYVAPAEFLRELRALCDRHGIVFIADEIQSGAGRTGTWLAIEHSGVIADLVTMAKSIAGGFPISAVLGRADIMDAPGPGGLGGTYAGNPLACAAALAVLDVFEEEKLLDRGRRLGQRLQDGLQQIARRSPAVGDVRGLGPMVAIELIAGGRADQPDAELTRRLVAEAARRGLILISCGIYANVIRVLVPLTAPDALVDEGLKILSESLDAVTA